MGNPKNQKERDEKARSNMESTKNDYDVDTSKKREGETDAEFSQRIMNATDVSLADGPFHYQMRSG